MSLISVRSDLRGAARDVKKMQNIVKQASASAINRAASSAKTAGTRKTRERYQVRAGDVNATFSPIRKAKADGLSAVIRSKSKSLPLINFKTNPKNPMAPNQPRGGVKSTVLRGEVKRLKSAFVARVGGHVGVYERTTTKRLPLKELYGPPVPYMLNNDEVRGEIEQKFAETFETRFPHEMDRLLGKLVR